MSFYRGFIQFVCGAHFVVAVATKTVVARIWLPDKSLVGHNFFVMLALNTWEAFGLLYIVGYFLIQFDSLMITLMSTAGVYFRMLRGYFEDVGRRGGGLGVKRKIVWGVNEQRELYELRDFLLFVLFFG